MSRYNERRRDFDELQAANPMGGEIFTIIETTYTLVDGRSVPVKTTVLSHQVIGTNPTAMPSSACVRLSEFSVILPKSLNNV
jgi:hypothetical protein